MTSGHLPMLLGMVKLFSCGAALLAVGCGSVGAHALQRSPKAAAVEPPAHGAVPIGSALARCDGSVRLLDGSHDGHSWTSPNRSARLVDPPAGDLRRFELRSSKRGVCVRWTLARAVRAGTTLVFNAHGPDVRAGSTSMVRYGYGFDLEVGDTTARATYGLDALATREPRVLAVRVARSGRTVSAVVARSELDRPPANTPQRPPFPSRTFTFSGSVITPPLFDGSQQVDRAPERELGDAGYVDGRLCRAPCARLMGR